MSSNSVTSGEHANHTNGSNNPFDDVPQPQPAAATLTAMAGMVIKVPKSFEQVSQRSHFQDTFRKKVNLKVKSGLATNSIFSVSFFVKHH